MKRGLLLLSFLFAALAGTVCFFLFTSQGFHLVLGTVNQFTKGAVSAEDSGGRLAGRWWVSGLIVHSSAVDVSIGKLSVDWRFKDLFLGKFHASAIELEKLDIVVQQSEQRQPDQTRSAFDPPPIIFPLSMKLNRFAVDGGVVRTAGSPAPMFVINQLVLRAETNGNQLIVDELLLRSPEIDTTLQGNVAFTGSWPLSFQGKWQARPANYSPLNGSAAFSGTLENPEFELSVLDPFQVNLEGGISDAFSVLAWHLRAEIDGLDPRLLSADLPMLTLAAEVEATGTLDRYSGRIKAAVDPGGHIKPDFELLFSGSSSAVSIEPSAVDVGGNRAIVSARVDWSKDLLWNVLVKTDDFEVSALDPRINGQVSLTAGADGSYGDGLSYHLEVSDVIGTFAGLHEDVLGGLTLDGSESGLTIVSADFTLGEGHIDISGGLRWQEALSWDARVLLKSFSPGVVDAGLAGSVSAEIRTHGEMGLTAGSDGSKGEGLTYHLEVSDVIATFAGLHEDVLGGLTLDGSESGLTIVSSDFTLGEGHIDISGGLRWQEALSWDARALLKSFSPAVFEPSVEGSVNAEIGSTGVFSEERLEVDVELKNVSGLLGGYEVSGGGAVDYRDGNIGIDNLLFKNGKNQLEIHGRIADTLALSFLLEGSELTRLIPSLGGAVRAHGNVTGTKAYPELVMVVDAENLSFREYSAAAIAADIKVSTAQEGVAEAAVTAEQLTIPGTLVRHAGVELSGSREQHQLSVAIDSDHGALSVSTAGMLDADNVWRGQITALRAEHPRLGVLHSSGVPSLQLSKQSADIREFCLASEDIRFCLEGAWRDPSSWSVAIRDLEIDGTLLTKASGMTAVLSGKAHGSAAAAGEGLFLSALTAEFVSAEMVLDAGQTAYYKEMKWFDTAVTLSLKDKLLAAKLSSRFVDGSIFSGNLGVSDVGALTGPFADLSVNGSLQATINDLAPLSILTDDYLQPSGRLSADLVLAGTIAEPRFSGGINLADGEIHIPQLNITPKRISGSLSGTDKSVSVLLEAFSGAGKATAAGAFTFDADGWFGNFRVTGDKVTLINQKELQIIANPDMLLELGSAGGRLSGTLAVPEALIQPEEMSGSVSESADVVIVQEEDATPWPFELAVKIILGDNVKVDGYGLSGLLRGSLELAEGKSGSLAGTGELYLENGEFSFYDRKLEITRGAILFGGGPVDNPGLDVSARKTLKAKELGEDDIVVGVNVLGSVDDYEMELFSIPPMDEADIIAYIVVGTSVSSASSSESGAIGAALSAITMKQGNKILGDIGGLFAVDDLKLEGSGADDTSLVVGKQLLDDLYLSYDFNLYKNAGFFRIRYDFGKGFSVESKNSIDSNGVNLLYSFER